MAEFQKAVTLSGGSALMKAALGHAYAAAGKRTEAERVLGELFESARQRYVSPYQIATVYAGLGENDRAFEYLDKAYEERSEWLVYLKGDPRLVRLHADPRFAEIARRAGLAP